MNNDKKYEFNWPFFGNQHIIDFLQTGISNNSLSHFYIFSGPRDLGKSTLANFFSRSILCENFNAKRGKLPCGECVNCRQKKHSDITVVEKEADKKNISIEQIREFIKMMNMGSFGNSYKIGIIREAENLSIEAANALLKTLEEPKNKVLIIALTSWLDKLPLTVKSRGQTLLFKPTSHAGIYDYLIKEHKASRDFALKLSKISVGRPALAAKLFQEEELFKQRKQTAESLINVIRGDLNLKFKEIDSLLGAGKNTQEQRENALFILEIWQTIARDLLMIQSGLSEFSINGFSSSELNRLNLNSHGLIMLNDNIKKGRGYLAANVNPKLVLENICLQITN
ncbi:MAG: AAA family ATPase [Patescibacteria group bacterium]|jgi:DNA polymerase-3 subunit delta'